MTSSCLEGAEYFKLISLEGHPPDRKLQSKIDDDLARKRDDRKKKRGVGIGAEKSVSLDNLKDLQAALDNRLAGSALVRKHIEIIRDVNGLMHGTVFDSRYSKVGDDWLLADKDIYAEFKSSANAV